MSVITLIMAFRLGDTPTIISLVRFCDSKLYDFTRTFGRRRRLALRTDRASINLQRPTAVLFGHPVGEYPQARRQLARVRVENVDRQRSWREGRQDLDEGAALQFRGHA